MTQPASMRVSRRFGRNIAGVSALVCLLLSLVAALPPAFAAGQTEVKVMVKNEKGTPVVDMAVVLKGLDTAGEFLAQAPVVAKTNKKGLAWFPILPYNNQGLGRWDVSIEDEKYFIRHYKFESRQLTSQEQGRGTLQQQEDRDGAPHRRLVAMLAKPGGTVDIQLTVALLSDYASPAQAGAGAGAPAAAAQPQEDPLSKARMLAAEGHLPEALEALKALKETQDSVGVEFELARVYHMQEKPAEERKALASVLALDPGYQRVHYELGRMAYENGNVDEAVKEFEAELKTSPDDPEVVSALGALYIQKGRTDDAIKLYLDLLAKEPDSTDVLVSLDGLYTLKGETQKSEEVFKKIVAQSPEGADQTYYNVGAKIVNQSEISAGDRERAIAAFNKAVKLNPKNAKAQRELGYLYLNVGDMAEAKKHFQSYLDADPGAKDAGTIRQFLQGG